MSGIYIKGMEMPTEKAIAVVIHPDGTAYSSEMFVGVCTEYLKGCEAIPLPPHGRLIDADALGEFPYNMDFCDGGEADEWVRDAPTIIPADKEGKA